MPRRSLVVTLVVLAVAASACGTASKFTASAGQAVPGTLVVDLSADPGQLNPALTTRGAVHAASDLIYNGLVSLDANNQPMPELATSWKVENGSSVYRFTLRNDVMWHDGVPFTSADVKYTFEEALLKFHARAEASIAPVLAGIDIPDDSTVVFRFTQPYVPFLQQLDVTEAPIIAKHLYEGSDPRKNPTNDKPVGTGPFKFVSYAKGSTITLDRNANYFRPGRPVFDRVVMNIVSDPADRVADVKSGRASWVWDVPAADRSDLASDPNVQTVSTPWGPGGSNCMVTLSFNLDRARLQNPGLLTR